MSITVLDFVMDGKAYFNCFKMCLFYFWDDCLCDDSLSYRIWLLSEISYLFTGNLPRFKTERDKQALSQYVQSSVSLTDYLV